MTPPPDAFDYRDALFMLLSWSLVIAGLLYGARNAARRDRR